jgi:uncharacterized protein YbjT (DUF2867 family)
MDLLPHALRQAAAPAPTAAPPPVLVAGARGALGSAVVERLLASGAFSEVRVLVTQPFASTARGLRAVLPAVLEVEFVALDLLDRDGALGGLLGRRGRHGRRAPVGPGPVPC